MAASPGTWAQALGLSTGRCTTARRTQATTGPPTLGRSEPTIDTVRLLPTLAAAAARQDGLVTRTQALGAGMSESALRHAIRRDGPWQRIAPGVYAVFTGALTERQRLRAALLAAGPGAILSGADACLAHDMKYVPRGQPTLVLVPHSRRAHTTNLAVVRRVIHLPAPRNLRGLPCVPVERAVVDTLRRPSSATPGPSLRDTRALVCESVQRQRTTPARLIAEIESAPRNGTALLRRALADVSAGCWSAPECETLDLVRSSHILPLPHVNTPLPDLEDVTPDGWWLEARLAYEIDSAEHHRYGLSPERTQRRQSRMASAGWRVMPISPSRLRHDQQALRTEMETAYLKGIAQSLD